jgi:3-oxoacyl-[acyl-carrier-protein] synthase II
MSTAKITAKITGRGFAMAGVNSPPNLMVASTRALPAADPARRLGKKGLRYKDRATQLAYSAAADVLRESGLLDENGLTVASETIGVIASSNLGNADTVCRVVDTLREETVTGTSPMDLPNASSNVIATSVAIRFGLRGPNLMVCNGDNSGVDAVFLATTMIAAGRVERVLVLGVEPDSEPARKLLGAGRVLDGAVALLVESDAAATERGARPLGTVAGHARAADLAACLAKLGELDPNPPALWQVPAGGRAVVGPELLEGVPRFDLTHTWGASSGALGVLQCAAAVEWFGGGGTGPVYVTSGTGATEGVAGLVLSPAGT